MFGWILLLLVIALVAVLIANEVCRLLYWRSVRRRCAELDSLYDPLYPPTEGD